MKVLHVTPSFYPALVYGGPTQSVYQLCCALVRNKCEVRVLTTDANGPDAVLNVDTHREVEIVKALWEMVCRSAAPQTFILHVTSVEEAKQSAARMPGLEMAVIANGVEIPESATHNTGHHGLRVVYLGRLDPIKGIENLLQARSIL